MAASESLRFDITANDKASDAFSRVGRSAEAMSGKMGDAAAKAAFLDDALKRQAETARRSSDATLALAKSDEILKEVEDRLRDGALEAELALKRETEAKKKSRDAALEAAAANKKLKDSQTGILGRIGNLIPGLAGTSGGASGLGALGPAGSGLANPYVLTAGAIAAAAAAPLIGQALAGGSILGLGGGLAGLGILGAFGTGKTVTAAQMTAAQDRLAAAQAAVAKKSTPASQATLITAQANLAQLQNNQQTPQQLQMRRAFSSLSNDAQNSLAQIGKSFIPVMQSVFNTADSVLKKMTPLFAGAEKAIAGPFKVFADTLLNAFTRPDVKASITAVAGAFGKLLTALTPAIAYGASQLADGISRIARSVSDHPQAFADFIQGIFKIAGIVLDAISALANFEGYLQQHFWPAMHRTSVIFDGVRHEVAHIADDMASALIRTYNALWNTLIGSTIRFGHNIETQWNSVTHEIAVIFDGMRGQLGRIYNNFWNDTIGATIRFGHNIETQFNSITSSITGFFKAMPGKIAGVMGNAANVLLNWGKGVINGLLAGMGSVIGSVWNFVKSIPSKILGFLGIHSPPQWAIDAGRHIMDGLGIGMSQAQAKAKAATASFQKSVAGQVASNFGGVQQWSGLVAQALRMEGLPAGLASNVLYQMQTESGGNPNAQNNSDINAQMGIPSQGLMQVIPPTFSLYHWPGTSWNIRDPLANIAAAINYARHVYGPSLMSGGMGIGSGHGYASGTMSAAPGWAWVGERGPELMHFRGGEQVYPAGGGGGGSVHITVNVPPTVNPASAGQQIANLLGAHIKRGGRIYPAGVTPR